MFRFILTLLLTLCLSNIAFAKTGKGTLKLDKETMEVLIMYMYGAGNTKYSADGKRKNNPSIMAVSENGYGYMYSYCPAAYGASGCKPPNAYKIMKLCEKHSNGSPCYIFAKKRKIVWKNGGDKVKIKKSDLKSPYKVAKIIQDAGFYDGDINELAGINASTGQVDKTIKITGENKSNKKSNSSNSTDIVKELETLTSLYESGSLSKEEFDKAKNKLLNN